MITLLHQLKARAAKIQKWIAKYKVKSLLRRWALELTKIEGQIEQMEWAAAAVAVSESQQPVQLSFDFLKEETEEATEEAEEKKQVNSYDLKFRLIAERLNKGDVNTFFYRSEAIRFLDEAIKRNYSHPDCDGRIQNHYENIHDLVYLLETESNATQDGLTRADLWASLTNNKLSMRDLNNLLSQ